MINGELWLFERGHICVLNRSGVDEVRIHRLRHTCSSWLYNGRAGLDGVSKWLDHKDPKNTQRSAHVNDDYLQDVIGGHKCW